MSYDEVGLKSISTSSMRCLKKELFGHLDLKQVDKVYDESSLIIEKLIKDGKKSAMNRVDLNWILQFRVDGSVKPSRLKEIWALCIMYMYFDFIQCIVIETRPLKK